MPTKKLERLIFAQGGACFFCKKKLTKAEASVEHLVATANGGRNEDENCVACCRALNRLLGSMSLKEKLQVVLNQKGLFRCPNEPSGPKQKKKKKKQEATNVKVEKDAGNEAANDTRMMKALEDLRKRGAARPRSLKTLTSTLNALFQKKLDEAEVAALIDAMTRAGYVKLMSDKVSYALPGKDA